MIRRLPGSVLAAPALGALTVLGFAPYGLSWLPFLALAALYWLWRQAASARAAALRGFGFGLGLFGAGVSWIYVSLQEFGGMPVPLAVLATLLFCSFLALFYALPGYLLQRFFRPGPTAPLAFAALLALSEWTRGLIFTGFPWLSLGYSQGPDSPLAPLAPVLGVYGVSLILAALSALVVEAVWQRGRYVLYPAGLLAACLALQLLPPYTRPAGPPVAVSLLQGNIGQSLKWAPEQISNSIGVYDTLIDQSRARLLITPETAWPLLLEQMPPAYLDSLQQRLRARGAVLLVGVPERRDNRYYNSMLLVDGDGIRQSYQKQHLVPFGEYIPPAFGWVLKVLSIPMSDFARGPANQPPFAVGPLQLGIAICYEDVFGEEMIGWLPQANVLVNVSNDAWFGKSFAAAQHLEIARMRSMETGRMLLRATNTGMTAVIDAQGRITHRLPPHQAGVLEVSVRPYTGLTPYARIGNAAVLLLALGGLVLARRKGRG